MVKNSCKAFKKDILVIGVYIYTLLKIYLYKNIYTHSNLFQNFLREKLNSICFGSLFNPHVALDLFCCSQPRFLIFCQIFPIWDTNNKKLQ